MVAMKLLISTRNPHKLEEILAIFRAPDLALLSMRDIPDLPDVVEDGDTFEANATLKAVTLMEETGLWTLADDSGLEVTALGGEPGVYSARYSGEPVDYARNNTKLLANLEDKEDRSARFRCVVALAEPGGECLTVEGQCTGRIAEAPRGDSGFGYDPVFIPDGYDQTFAELAPALKNRISHRGNALKKAAETWREIFERLAGGSS